MSLKNVYNYKKWIEMTNHYLGFIEFLYLFLSGFSK